MLEVCDIGGLTHIAQAAGLVGSMPRRCWPAGRTARWKTRAPLISKDADEGAQVATLHNPDR